VTIGLGLVGMIALVGCSPPAAAPIEPEAREVLAVSPLEKQMQLLADPALGGRVSGTRGAELVARYIAQQFDQAGLQKTGDVGTWYQRFPLEGIQMSGPVSYLRTDQHRFRPGRDFAPMAIGDSGEFQGRLVFVGYGLKEPERHYNDYKKMTARGGVVMILQGEPHDPAGNSRWGSRGVWTDRIDLVEKLRTARQNGARAALVVSPPTISGAVDPLEQVRTVSIHDRLIPAMRISRAAANRLLAAAGQETTVTRLADQINRTGRPASFSSELVVEGECDLVPGIGRNVMGLLPHTPPPGADPSLPADPPPVLLVAAHYDGVSPTGRWSADKGFGVRAGADNNASGVAVLLQLARACSHMVHRNCDMVFVAFDGGEMNHQGSSHYVQHPPVPLERTKVMINLDQVGRLRHDELFVIGEVDRSPWLEILDKARQLNDSLTLERVALAERSFWSENAPFAAAGVESLYFFTGLHPQHRRRGDTLETINLAGLSKVARLVFDVIRLADVQFGPPGQRTEAARETRHLRRMLEEDLQQMDPTSRPAGPM
jgi:hypothetical protein